MKAKLLYFFIGLTIFLNYSQSAFAQYYHPYLDKEPRIDIFYSAKKLSLTQDYEVIINNKGDVIVSKNDYYGNKPKVLNSRLSEPELLGLKEFIINTDIFQFNNEYVVGQDFVKMDGERLKIKVDGRTKEIVISSSSVPAKLRAIINKVEEIRQRIEKENETDTADASALP